MENDTIAPALTREQWTTIDAEHWTDAAGKMTACIVGSTRMLSIAGDNVEDGMDFAPSELPALIALANDALPVESPYKVTRADVVGLAGAIAELKDFNGCFIDELTALARKLEALLRLDERDDLDGLEWGHDTASRT